MFNDPYNNELWKYLLDFFILRIFQRLAKYWCDLVWSNSWIRAQMIQFNKSFVTCNLLPSLLSIIFLSFSSKGLTRRRSWTFPSSSLTRRPEHFERIRRTENSPTDTLSSLSRQPMHHFKKTLPKSR